MLNFMLVSLNAHFCHLSAVLIDSGGNVSDLVLARNCCLARMLPGEAENGVGMNRSVREAGKAKSVKRFERSNGLDTALYKNYLFYTDQGAAPSDTTSPLEVASTRGQHLRLQSSSITIRCEQHLHGVYNGWFFRVPGITKMKSHGCRHCGERFATYTALEEHRISPTFKT